MIDSADMLGEIRQEFPKFRLVHKRDDRLSQLIDVLLKLLTLGSQHAYMTEYHTVIGYTLYVPEAWKRTSEVEKTIVLRHERVHLRQRRRLGLLLMAFLYLIPFFPLGLAYGRARLEWEAYEETLRATFELLGPEALHEIKLRESIVTRFMTGAYGWMWPFRNQVETWYDTAVSRIDGQRD